VKYIDLGTTGMTVSRLGFGSWAMSGPNSPSYWGPQDDEDSITTIRTAVDRGVNWIDTAAIYGMGHAERVVGRAIAQIGDADRPYVFTKAGMRWDREAPDAQIRRTGTPESIREEVEASLTRLGVERIDLYQMHWPASDADVEDYWAVFRDLVDSGKVRAVGVSNHTVDQLRAALSVGAVDTNQVPFNLLRADESRHLLDVNAQHGIASIIYSPMASGLLTGKYSREYLAALDENDWRRRAPQFAEESIARLQPLVDALAEVGRDHRSSAGSIAVAWALAQPGVDAAIVGARAPHQVDDWVDSADIELDVDQLALIDARRADYAAAEPSGV
jgi:aryl-alcohol dehydrogenase-like predicted oxidoreductase